jgi:hypothetical protein
MDPPMIDDEDITILTTDKDVREVLWDLNNDAEKEGDKSFAVSETMAKSLPSIEHVYEIFVAVNEVAATSLIVTKIYKILKPSNGKGTRIRIAGSLKLSRDDKDRLESIGCEITYEKSET